MGCAVEDLDALLVSIPVHPEQVPALGAAMDRYRCETVAQLAEVLVLKAIQSERCRAALLSARRVRG